MTRWGALVRSDDPAKLTGAGWAALYAYGIRTIVSLRTDGMEEEEPEVSHRPSDLTMVSVAIEDFADAEFLSKWAATNLWGTPLYYRDALERWPERHVAAIAAIAQAKPGGVLLHCLRGQDRTGILALLLLALVGVLPEVIASDYEMSHDPYRDELLKGKHTTTHEVILDTLSWLNAENYLLEGGLSQSDLEAVRVRFLEPIRDAA
jgi:hypothetical protein